MRILTGIFIAICAINSWAQNQRPYKIVLPFAPSNNYGIAFNRVAEPLTTAAKASVIFDYQVGANGLVAMHKFQALNDDRAFLVTNASVFTLMPMSQKVDYKPEDLEPLAIIGTSPMCYATRSDVRDADFNRFVMATRGGFYGILSNTSIEAALLRHISKSESLAQTPVAYKFYPDVVAALLRGDIQWAIAPKIHCGRVPDSGPGIVELRNVPAKYDMDYWFGDYWWGIFSKKTMDRRTREEFVDTFIDVWWQNKEAVSKTVTMPRKDLRHAEFKQFINGYGKKWEPLVKNND
jgi:hypothetical protein